MCESDLFAEVLNWSIQDQNWINNTSTPTIHGGTLLLLLLLIQLWMFWEDQFLVTRLVQSAVLFIHLKLLLDLNIAYGTDTGTNESTSGATHSTLLTCIQKWWHHSDIMCSHHSLYTYRLCLYHCLFLSFMTSFWLLGTSTFHCIDVLSDNNNY